MDSGTASVSEWAGRESCSKACKCQLLPFLLLQERSSLLASLFPPEFKVWERTLIVSVRAGTTPQHKGGKVNIHVSRKSALTALTLFYRTTKKVMNIENSCNSRWNGMEDYYSVTQIKRGPVPFSWLVEIVTHFSRTWILKIKKWKTVDSSFPPLYSWSPF